MEDSQIRLMLAKELYQRYVGSGKGLARRIRFWRKKYAPALVVGGAQLFKRLIHIFAASILLILLSPLFLLKTIPAVLLAKGLIDFAFCWRTERT